MNVTVVGTGYVGLVAGACLAESGHIVTCVDIDEEKVRKLWDGIIPIYEPGLEPLVKRNVDEERLTFTTDITQAVKSAYVIFIAVGTPPDEDGSADLQHVLAVAKSIGQAMDGERVVITKSTVPVGTARRVRQAIEAETDHPVHVCSNPEFLKEGDAVDDFMKPDRVVIGVDHPRAEEALRELYAPFLRTGNSLLVMDVPAAEITKYAANAMLATRISFMNAIAHLCEKTGASVDAVRAGVGSDSRIGSSFLFPGAGYGGSCFVGEESLLVREGSRARLVTFAQLFSEYADGTVSASGDPEPEVVWADDLEILSWSRDEGPTWRPAQVLTRRWHEGDLVTVRTKMGRRVECTPDHPFVVSDGTGGAERVILASDLTTNDWLPVAFGRPIEGRPAKDYAVASSLSTLGFADEDVIVRLSGEAHAGLERSEVLDAVAEHPRGRSRADDILRNGTLRLHEMDAPGVPASEGTFGTARNGTCVPATLEADEAFWRVVGLYLAEGCCTTDQQRMRLQWSFHPTQEPELVAEVADFWNERGIKASVYQGTTSRIVSIASRILAEAWLRRLGLGADCYSHRLPDAVWTLPEQHRVALLSGLWQGDGSWSLVAGGPSVVLEWGTVSRAMADGVLRLLGSMGIGARLKIGRTARSTVDTYWLIVSGADQVERLIDLVKPADREGVRISISRQTRRIAPTGFRPEGATAWVRVVETTPRPFHGWVYSAEVPGTETLVTTGGLVTHNCFPKDVKALVRTMNDLGAPAQILEAVEEVNAAQKQVLLERVVARFGEDLSGRTFAIWGLSFKPNTDDMREAPSLVTIAGLLERGAKVVAHDPEAMEETERVLGDSIEYRDREFDVLPGADALIIHTEWLQYRRPDLEKVKGALKQPIVFDGRNLYDPHKMEELGFEYTSIGRPTVGRSS